MTPNPKVGWLQIYENAALIANDSGPRLAVSKFARLRLADSESARMRLAGSKSIRLRLAGSKSVQFSAELEVYPTEVG